MHLRGPATTSSLPESATRRVCFQLFTCRKLWVCVCAPAAHATTDCPCTSLVFCSRLWVCIMLEVVKHPMTQSAWVACRSLLFFSFAKNGGAPHTALSNCHDTANPNTQPAKCTPDGNVRGGHGSRTVDLVARTRPAHRMDDLVALLENLVGVN